MSSFPTLEDVEKQIENVRALVRQIAALKDADARDKLSHRLREELRKVEKLTEYMVEGIARGM